jgi:histone acetyltransferase (RNA polymerase elongator complex component)
MQAIAKPLIVPIFLPHAGCPHRCVFCNQNAITRVPSGFPGNAELVSTIERFLGYGHKRKAVRQIAFFGGNFLGLDPTAVASLLSSAQGFVKAGRVDGIRFSTRPDSIDRRRLDLLSPYSVGTVELGVQSMIDDVLHRCRRGHTAAQTVAAVKRLKDDGYAVGLQVMVGLPGDSTQRALESARRLIDLQPEFVRIYPTLVLEGSPLAEWYRRGQFTPLSLDGAVDLVKTLYLMFVRHGIPVVRMGLQAERDLAEGGDVVAGPWHPAFGHLVQSRIYLDAALAALKSDAGPMRIYVNPNSLSKMRGYKNRNLAKLRSECRSRKIEILADPALDKDSIRLAETTPFCVTDVTALP